MTLINPSFPIKSRDEIIDTAHQLDKETSVLKMLIVILFFSLCYEFGGEIIRSFANEKIQVAELGKAKKRKIPSKVIQGLMELMADLQERVPLVRVSMKASFDRLERIQETLERDPAHVQAISSLGDEVENLWMFFHRPVWEDKTPFSKVNHSITLIFKRLDRKPPDTDMLPAVSFGPRKLFALRHPKRDLFKCQ